MGRTRLKWIHEEEPSINITPLIDVVFVVLIMFILIAPLVDREGVDLARGGAGEGARLKETSQIVIHVSKDNLIEVNHQPVRLDQLVTRLKEVRQGHPQAIPQLFHDRAAPFGTYQEVKIAAEKAGFPQLELVLNPKND